LTERTTIEQRGSSHPRGTRHSLKKHITIALAGNPNSGKTTVFNNLTGARQHVGNYPGVTVEKKEGSCTFGDYHIHVVDLPGTYGLSAYSLEEIVARNFVIDEHPDVVVDIVDASNLERNLYLAVQFKELGIPLVVALNMSDLAEARGIHIDAETLSHLFGNPMVPTVATRKKGMEALLRAVVSVATGSARSPGMTIDYGQEIEEELECLETIIAGTDGELRKYIPRWIALKLLEADTEIQKKIDHSNQAPSISAQAEKSRAHLARICGDDPEAVIADYRYGFLKGAVEEAVRRHLPGDHLTASDKIDRIVTNHVLGIPLFLAMMWVVFQLTFRVAAPPMQWIEAGTDWLARVVTTVAPEGHLQSLLADGVIGGVGGVIVFLPNILLLFLAIAALEDSGYMARAAFIMDRVMHKIGLHGKSFIPMLIGFGCSVPAIMATRILEERRDRMTTILVIPLISCGARLPVYTLLIAAFFRPQVAGNVLFSIYVLGILAAVLVAKLLRGTIFSGPSTPFVMELPPYRIPTLRGLCVHTWQRGWMYLRKAGTFILAFSILMWFLMTFPADPPLNRDYRAEAADIERDFASILQPFAATLGLSPEDLTHDEELNDLTSQIDSIHRTFTMRVSDGHLEEGTPKYEALHARRDRELAQLQEEHPALSQIMFSYFEAKTSHGEALARLASEERADRLGKSYAGHLGHALEPLLRPVGFDWKIAVALVGGLTAKEVVISTLATVYGVAESDEEGVALREALRRDPTFSPLVAYALMVFILLYVPCMVALIMIAAETGSWKWAAFAAGYSSVLAWFAAFVVYQGGHLLRLG